MIIAAGGCRLWRIFLGGFGARLGIFGFIGVIGVGLCIRLCSFCIFISICLNLF